MTRDEIDAVVILNDAFYKLSNEHAGFCWSHWWQAEEKVNAQQVLFNAIRHICRPERDIYPKTRKGTKRKPVVRL